MSRLDLSHPVTQDDHVIGNPNAVVQLVEYGDYECPYCAEAFNIVDQLREHFGNDLLYIFRNYPLSEIHPDALRAAEAAEATGETFRRSRRRRPSRTPWRAGLCRPWTCNACPPAPCRWERKKPTSIWRLQRPSFSI